MNVVLTPTLEAVKPPLAPPLRSLVPPFRSHSCRIETTISCSHSHSSLHSLTSSSSSLAIIFSPAPPFFHRFHRLLVPWPSTISPSIGKLTNLTNVRFFANYLNGTVPRELGNLSSLVVLHLARKLVNFIASSNHFIGPISVNLINCPSLYKARFKYNMLIGYADEDLEYILI
ncbi:hypothetical protein Ahy_A04g019850 [Arachis hypogaea]|uniref:LRR receptor-like serine/threonine-protein kinase n=1 Tax=Arachis hypogaea TaxID=3818 RepID=A0A445DGV6_ARAHY|nr:hypothetical protein Ahy_A04g019850 [Arachis hypogaea]